MKEQDRYRELKKKADNGDADAMNQIGVMYYEGDHLPQDYRKAMYWYKKAAAAFHLYLRCYQSFEEIEDTNDEEVYSGVCLRLARCLYEGIGTERNLDAACDLVNKAVHFFRIRYRRHDIFCEDGFRQAKELRDKINADLEEQDA